MSRRNEVLQTDVVMVLGFVLTAWLVMLTRLTHRWVTGPSSGR